MLREMVVCDRCPKGAEQLAERFVGVTSKLTFDLCPTHFSELLPRPKSEPGERKKRRRKANPNAEMWACPRPECVGRKPVTLARGKSMHEAWHRAKDTGVSDGRWPTLAHQIGSPNGVPEPLPVG